MGSLRKSLMPFRVGLVSVSMWILFFGLIGTAWLVGKLHIESEATGRWFAGAALVVTFGLIALVTFLFRRNAKSLYGARLTRQRILVLALIAVVWLIGYFILLAYSPNTLADPGSGITGVVLLVVPLLIV